jgi:hypothetical protein
MRLLGCELGAVLACELVEQPWRENDEKSRYLGSLDCLCVPVHRTFFLQAGDGKFGICRRELRT